MHSLWIFATVDTCTISLIGGYVEKTILIRESVTFQCTCHNGTIQWMLNGTNIATNDTRYNTTSNTLTINGVRTFDSGSYTCDLDSRDSASLTVVQSKFFSIQ